MSFQVKALPPSLFEGLFWLSDAELKNRNIRRLTVTEKPGIPCRVSLADAEIGETVLLLNFEHQSADTPYRASHAIFVRRNAVEARPARGKVPELLRSRLISVRQFDEEHMMIDADVVGGVALTRALYDAFSNAATAYVHLHFAKHGCFAARVERR